MSSPLVGRSQARAPQGGTQKAPRVTQKYRCRPCPQGVHRSSIGVDHAHRELTSQVWSEFGFECGFERQHEMMSFAIVILASV